MIYKIHAHFHPAHGKFDIHITADDPRTGKRYIAQPIEMTEVEEGEVFVEPTLRIDDKELTILMNELASQNVHPTLSHLRPDQQHLDDLRTILFHKMGITK